MQINNGDYDPLKPVSAILKYDNSSYFIYFNFIIRLGGYWLFHSSALLWLLIVNSGWETGHSGLMHGFLRYINVHSKVTYML